MNFYTWDAQRTRHISLIVFFFSNLEELWAEKFVIYTIVSAFFKGYVNFKEWFLFLLAELQGKFISSQRNKQKMTGLIFKSQLDAILGSRAVLTFTYFLVFIQAVSEPSSKFQKNMTIGFHFQTCSTLFSSEVIVADFWGWGVVSDVTENFKDLEIELFNGDYQFCAESSNSSLYMVSFKVKLKV